MSLPIGLVERIGPYVARQRWYAGSGRPAPGSLAVVNSARLATLAGGRGCLHWAMVEVEGVRYQVLIGERPTGEAAESLVRGADAAVLGRIGSAYFYDAVIDAELMVALHQVVVGSAAQRVRLVGAEQSNTSAVYDDRTIVKVYRRPLAGVNPDIEVTSALASAGFDHVPEPVATWRADGVDLAFAQRFLAGGSEGWDLALASVRGHCDVESDDPGAPAVDFAPEASRLGEVTAELHVALARVFPLDPDGLRGGWAAFVDDLEQRLGDEVGEAVAEDDRARLVSRLRSVRDAGPALRVHGDFHLGQVMRAGGTWYVLDFEGEPARGMAERVRPSSTAKDVAGMLRSLDYAARFALRGRDPATAVRDRVRTRAWEQRNRAAYLAGYRRTEGIEALLAAPAEVERVLAAFELDKALYELRYEKAYRPEWVEIPRAAIVGIVERIGRAGTGD